MGAHANSAICPGIGRRVGDYPNIKPLVPIRYANNGNNNNNNNINNSNSSMTTLTKNNSRANLTTKLDIDIQKENKFKQIFEQNNIDLSKNFLSIDITTPRFSFFYAIFRRASKSELEWYSKTISTASVEIALRMTKSLS